MKVLISDEYELIRESVAALVDRLIKKADIIQAKTDEETIAVAQSHQGLELAIIGLKSSTVQSLPMVGSMCALLPETPVVFLSACENRDCVVKAFEYGASGFVYKSQETAVLEKALIRAMEGNTFVPPINQNNERTSLEATPRQCEILEFLAKGKSNKEIARTLGISPNTIKNHLAKLYYQLGASNRTQAVMRASELISDDLEQSVQKQRSGPIPTLPRRSGAGVEAGLRAQENDSDQP